MDLDDLKKQFNTTELCNLKNNCVDDTVEEPTNEVTKQEHCEVSKIELLSDNEIKQKPKLGRTDKISFVKIDLIKK